MNQSIWLHRCPGGKRFDAPRPNSLTMFANLVHRWQRLYLQFQSSRRVKCIKNRSIIPYSVLKKKKKGIALIKWQRWNLFAEKAERSDCVLGYQRRCWFYFVRVFMKKLRLERLWSAGFTVQASGTKHFGEQLHRTCVVAFWVYFCQYLSVKSLFSWFDNAP